MPHSGYTTICIRNIYTIVERMVGNNSLSGGNTIAPGMGLMVTKPTQQAGLAIGNCRVIANNQIGSLHIPVNLIGEVKWNEDNTIANFFRNFREHLHGFIETFIIAARNHNLEFL